jgi:Zn-dependent protease
VIKAPGGQGWRLLRLAGIPIHIHPSWLVVLVLASLLFQQQFGGNFFAGFATAVLLFFSVLLHELGHSLVALRLGVKVNSITLFMLGGVASVERDPPTPMGALAVAAAGPLVSLLLALLLFFAIHPFAHAMPLLGSVAQELAQLNLVLALFNLLPGLPLDGGQIIKALVWQLSGSREKGVRVASFSGQLLAWGAIFIGVYLFFKGGSFLSIWLVLLGWFGLGASSNQLQLLALQRALQQLQVKDAAGRRLRVLEPTDTLRRLSELRLSSDSPRPDWVLLCAAGRWQGFIDDRALKKIPVQNWNQERLGDHQRPLTDLASITESAPLWQAVLALETSAEGRLLVLSAAGLPMATLERPDLSEAVLRRLSLRLPQQLLEQARKQGGYPLGLSLAPIAESVAALPEVRAASGQSQRKG